MRATVGRIAARLLASVLLILAASASAQGQAPSTGYNPAGIYSLDDWMTIASVGSFLWSPDGEYIYYTSDAADTGTDEIFRLSVRSGEAVQLTGRSGPHVGASPIALDRPEPKESIALSADGRTLYYQSARFFQAMTNLYSMSAEGGSPTQLTFHDAISESGPTPSPAGDLLAYVARTSRGHKIRLIDLSGKRFWPQLMDTTSLRENSPVWSPDGKRLAMQRSGDIWIRDLATGRIERAVPAAYPGGNSSPVWSPDGTRITFENDESGHTQIGVLELQTGRVTPLTYAQRDHSSVAWSPDGRWVTFLRSDSIGMSREVLIAAADGSGEPRVLVQGQGVRSGLQFSPRGDSIAYVETTPTRARDIWLISTSGGRTRQLTSSMGKVDPAKLSMPEQVFYAAVDNLRIPALLFRPSNFDPSRKYPVIVSLHGHPGQWNNSMNTMWQYFVQKGFVVIAPNPRGSTGFGQAFHDLHVGDQGGTEYEDVMGSLKYLAKLPYIDMNRKASEGASGGGYMSFVIATHAPGVYMTRNPSEPHEVFQAQVIRVASSSRRHQPLEQLVSPARFGRGEPTPDRIERSEFGGPYDLMPDRYEERSPINYVERVTVPQLIMVGLRDGSVPFNGSRRWVQRMHQLGKGHLAEYIEYPDEDHSLSRYRSTVRDRLLRMERFLEEKLALR